jgi:putative phosphoesterase
MKLGIVADTHDDLAVAQQAVDTFEEADVDAVIHCGDVVAPFTAREFDGDFEFFAVRGNNDGEWALADAIEDVGTWLGEFGEFDLAGESIAVYHGTSGGIVGALVDSGNYDYVLHGHTHERREMARNDTSIINPGGIPTTAEGGPRPAAVVLDLETDERTWHDLTGQSL